jgi:hypothetical protein
MLIRLFIAIRLLCTISRDHDMQSSHVFKEAVQRLCEDDVSAVRLEVVPVVR